MNQKDDKTPIRRLAEKLAGFTCPRYIVGRRACPDENCPYARPHTGTTKAMRDRATECLMRWANEG